MEARTQVAAMNARPESIMVQRLGCSTLMKLALGDAACKQAIVDARVVAAMVAAMGQHTLDAEVQRCADTARYRTWPT